MRGIFVGAGSNIEPEENIKKALSLLMEDVAITQISTFYRTEPLGRKEQPFFYNGVIEIDTDMPPQKLKEDVLHGIETRLKRKRGHDADSPRTIDLDLIIYGGLVVNRPGLVLPDPDIIERPFLAVPLLELSPDLVIPGVNLRIRDAAQRFLSPEMEPLHDLTRVLRGLCLSQHSAPS